MKNQLIELLELYEKELDYYNKKNRFYIFLRTILLVLFIVLIFGLLSLLSNTKYSFDKFKHDLQEKLEAVNFKYSHEDYMLASESDIGTSDTVIYSFYKDEYTNIKSVNIVSKNSVPEGATQCYLAFHKNYADIVYFGKSGVIV